MLFFRFIARLPFSALYFLSDFLFFLSYYFVRYRRALVRKNLSNAYPEKTPKEISTIEKEFYRNLGDYAVETLKLLTITKEELMQRVIFKNVEPFVGYVKKDQPVLILASHQFNWEWLLASGNFSLPAPIDFVYQPVENKIVDQFLLTCRTRFGAHAIKRNELAREIIRRKNIIRGVAIVADQYPGQKRDKKYLTSFLNQETAFFYGTHQLVSLTQYPVLYAAMKKIKRGYYEVSFVPLTEPPYEKENNIILERYVQAAEKVIREYPAGWLWSHNRWKKRHLKQASEKYPPASAAS